MDSAALSDVQYHVTTLSITAVWTGWRPSTYASKTGYLTLDLPSSY